MIIRTMSVLLLLILPFMAAAQSDDADWQDGDDYLDQADGYDDDPCAAPGNPCMADPQQQPSDNPWAQIESNRPQDNFDFRRPKIAAAP